MTYSVITSKCGVHVDTKNYGHMRTARSAALRGSRFGRHMAVRPGCRILWKRPLTRSEHTQGGRLAPAA